MIKLVIFDLDDTLVPEIEFLKTGYRIVAKRIEEKYGLNAEKSYERLYSLFLNGEKNNFNMLLNENDIAYSKEEIQELIHLYRTYPRELPLYHDVTAFIHMLRKNEIAIGIITDGPVEAQKNKLKCIHAYDVFDYIVLTDELGIEFRKPNAKAFEMIIEQAGVKPEETMYIGDNPAKDFYIKKNLKIKTVRILRENALYANQEYLENVKEDVTITHLGEVRV